MNEESLNNYCKRIGYSGGLVPSLEVLKGIQSAQAYSIPFENFDISLNAPILLEFQNLFDKLVNRRRGGYCYEVNGLLHFALQSIGFNEHLSLARLMDQDGNLLPDSVHMVIVVELEQRWLVDAGWGGGFVYPICLDTPVEQHGCKVEHNNGEYTLFNQVRKEEWIKLYQFNMEKRPLECFQERNLFHQQSTRSPFAKERICELPTKEGYELIKGNLYIKKDNLGKSEISLKNDSEYRRILSQIFGLNLEVNLPVWLHHDDFLLHSPRNRSEWEAYHSIRQFQVHQKYCFETIYDPNDSDEKDIHNYPLVFRKNNLDEILGTIRIDLLPNNEASFRWVAIDSSHTNKGLGTQMLLCAEKFLLDRGISLVRIPSAIDSHGFYARLGYKELPWPDMPEGCRAIFLAKQLIK